MIADVVSIVFRLLQMALFVRIVLSWIPHDPFHPFIQLLRQLTDWIMIPCRNLLDRFIPPTSIGIDFSPILAFFALDLAQRLLVGILSNLGM
jgi:YggT family protein